MFEVSWGETLVITGISIGIIGRKDLPSASRFLGTQVGRLVGLLQGARARADRFVADSDLSNAQNELRSGLREIDAVKGELAIAASSRGLVGRALSHNRAMKPANYLPLSPTNSSVTGRDYLNAAREMSDDNVSSLPSQPPSFELTPRKQSVAAVAEGEWEKQGIGFKSIAERGTKSTIASSGEFRSLAGGGSILSNLLQESLIHDQYDRAIQEQDEDLNKRVDNLKSVRDRSKGKG